jgi:molybdate transport system substrate-binding protein
VRTARKLLAALLVTASLSAGLAGCGSGSPGSGGTASARTSETARLSGAVTVFAAASLKATFTEIAADFESKNPGTKVTLNFAGSSDLAIQILQGAPADVFASADARSMAKLTDAKLIDGEPVDFATNILEIAVPPSNPASISSFADLAKPGVKVVVCAPQVPCGAATDTLEKAAGTTLTPVSEESSVTDVLGKVTSGEADAGLVYVTDVKTAGARVKGIPFAESDQAVNTYPIAAVGTSKNTDVARAFVTAVTGSGGRKVLSDAGFGTL